MIFNARDFHHKPKKIYELAINNKAVIMHDKHRDFIFELKAVKRSEYLSKRLESNVRRLKIHRSATENIRKRLIVSKRRLKNEKSKCKQKAF